MSGVAKFIGILGMGSVATLMAATQLLGNHSESSKSIKALTDANVSAFILKMADVTDGKDAEKGQLGATEWLMAHLSESGVFATQINYSGEGMPDKPEELSMTRDQYVGHVIEGLKAVGQHETKVTVESVSIDPSKKSASTVTVIRESGVLPVMAEDGTQVPVPVTGISYCEQTVALASENVIQLTGVKCSTTVGIAEGF
jgi:hypothetical protein